MNNFQYIVDTNGKQVAVILSIKQYEKILKNKIINTNNLHEKPIEMIDLSDKNQVEKKNLQKVFEDLMDYNEKFNLKINSNIDISGLCNEVNS